MKNTIITSVSALVFLVIGLFIGKSNKQIEIQTVTKTNIVEKPVENVVEKIVEKPVKEYVDKFVTNVVEQIIEKPISDEDLQRIFIGSLIENAKRFETDKIPKGVDSIRVNVFVSNSINKFISKEDLKNKVELDLRKIGVNVNDSGKYMLTVHIAAFQTNEGNSLVYEYKFNLNSIGYYFENEECYKGLVALWKKESSGIVGISKAESGFNSVIEKATTELCNIILKSKE
jgi:hypothetical protein